MAFKKGDVVQVFEDLWELQKEWPGGDWEAKRVGDGQVEMIGYAEEKWFTHKKMRLGQ